MTLNITSSSGSGTPVIGMRSVVYERRQEWTWMTSDEIDHLEERLSDKTLFQNVAILSFGASIPLMVEKIIDYMHTKKPTDLAIIIIFAAIFGAGILFQILACSRRQKLQTFKQQLFQSERKLPLFLQMVDFSSSSAPVHDISAA
jgi:hypothetical protein